LNLFSVFIGASPPQPAFGVEIKEDSAFAIFRQVSNTGMKELAFLQPAQVEGQYDNTPQSHHYSCMNRVDGDPDNGGDGRDHPDIRTHGFEGLAQRGFIDYENE
jgi:hypothetical protein